MGVEPNVRNVIEDEEAMVELERLGMMTTPVVTVVEEEVVIGFDWERLARVIGLGDHCHDIYHADQSPENVVPVGAEPIYNNSQTNARATKIPPYAA